MAEICQLNRRQRAHARNYLLAGKPFCMPQNYGTPGGTHIKFYNLCAVLRLFLCKFGKNNKNVKKLTQPPCIFWIFDVKYNMIDKEWNNFLFKLNVLEEF